MGNNPPVIKWLNDLGSNDVPLVGGKNASLGEMIQHLHKAGISVPDGFATTAQAYWDFLEANELREKITELLAQLSHQERPLNEIGDAIRRLFLESEFSDATAQAIKDAYRQLGEKTGRENPDVAVRSSATAEDLPEASFAGQQETFLNICGEDALLAACRRCFASLFTDRAIKIMYRPQSGRFEEGPRRGPVVLGKGLKPLELHLLKPPLFGFLVADVLNNGLLIQTDGTISSGTGSANLA